MMRMATAPIISLAVLSAAGVAHAQPRDGRIEVGAHATLLRQGHFDETVAGVGGRVSYDVSRWLAAEAEGSYFPRDHVSQHPSPGLRLDYRRQRAEALFGVKLGVRYDRLGFFARVRPGLIRLIDGGSSVDCVGDVCPLMLLARPSYRTEFALDLGGGLEFALTRRTVARMDLGDTMIRHRSFAPPCWGTSCSSHNFSSRLGVGVRF